MGNQTQDPNRPNPGKPGSQGGSADQQNRPGQDDNTVERRSSDSGQGREQQAGELDKDDEDMEVSGDGTQPSRDRNQADRSSNR